MPTMLDAGIPPRTIVEMQGGRRDSDGCGMMGAYFLGAVILFSLTFLGVRWLFAKVSLVLNQDLLSNTFFDIVLSCLVLIVGLGFYHLREKARLIYAAIEMGAASATAFVNFPLLIQKPFQSVIAVMGAIYITVRAFDNFYKWKAAKEKTTLTNNHKEEKGPV